MVPLLLVDSGEKPLRRPQFEGFCTIFCDGNHIACGNETSILDLERYTYVSLDHCDCDLHEQACTDFSPDGTTLLLETIMKNLKYTT